MTKPLALFVAALVTAAPLAVAHAQNTPSNSDARCAGAPSRTEGHQEFCFGDTDVHGDRALAREALSRIPRRANGTPLIRFRGHYVNEMLKSVENL